MTNKNTPKLKVSFHSQRNIENSSMNNVLKILHFGNGRKKFSMNLEEKSHGAELFIPAITQLDSEIWQIDNEETHFEEVPSGDDRIKIFKIYSPTYTFIRILCHEKNPEKLYSLSNTSDVSELYELTYIAYRKVFRLVKDGSLPKNIVRMWNFVPNILAHHKSLEKKDPINSERYRQFNAGRKQAWVEYSDLRINKNNQEYRVPAATGIGSYGGPLVVEAILTNDEIIDIPNPSQINAFSYSDKYGTSQPMFSRATIHLVGNGGILFIAGTASITGEDTNHLNDPVAQTHQTFKNLESIISKNNLSKYLPFKPKEISLSALEGVRVHIKHKDHFEVIKNIVEEYMGNKVVCYVNDDICRKNLLLEIESNGTLISVK